MLPFPRVRVLLLVVFVVAALVLPGVVLAQTVCSGDCTVTVVVTPAPYDQARIDDLNELLGWFFLALVTVWGLRKLLKIFDTDPYES